MLQAAKVEQHFEPVQHRVGVPMRLVEGARRRAGGARPLRSFGRRNSGVEADAAQAHEAEWFACHVDLARGLPEADGEANANRCPGANADRAGRIFDILLPEAGHRCRPDRDGHHTRPANVGDRIGELAGTRLRDGHPRHRDRDESEQGQNHATPHSRYHLSSSIRRRRPSWDTNAGTCVMPSFVVSAPCWSK